MIYTSPYTNRTRRGPKALQGPIRHKLHVVTHTHWDREWYGSFQEYRMRLVRMTDRLLDLLERSPEFRFFVFDGQTIVLEDYLTIRPENRERLKTLIQGGRIEIGPWYVLPDEFLVEGESLIRNLLTGHRLGMSMGGVMKVGYLPDSFGHVAQLPQILRGFQIDNFIFTRGLGDEDTTLGTEFLWIAPDGSRVLAVNQSKSYCNGDHIGYEFFGDRGSETPRFDLVVDFFRQEIAELGSRTKPGSDGTSNLLINNGCDHQEPNPDLPRLLAYANSVLPEIQIEHTTFTRFINALRRAGLALPDWSGEIRASKSHFLLPGVLSSRYQLKQQNDECENLLAQVAEPLGAMLWQRTGQDNASGYLNHAWKLLLQNHAHDSICGCGIDQVHRDMLPRFDEARQIGRLVTANALDFLAARVRRDEAPALVVVNTLAHARTQVLRTLLLVPPGTPLKDATLVDVEGRPVATQILKTRAIAPREGYALPEAFLRLTPTAGTGVRPLDHESKQRQIAAEVAAYGLAAHKGERPWRIVELEYLAENLPATGYRTYTLRRLASATLEHPVTVKGTTVENQYLKVRFAPDGTFVLHHKPTRRTFGPLNLLEDGADVGDTYDYCRPKVDQLVWSRNRRGTLRITHRSPLSVELEVNTFLPLPAQFDAVRERRSTRMVRCPVRWRFRITAASPWVEVELVVQNLAQDHRLRLHVPTPISAPHTLAGQPFYIAERPVKRPEGKNWVQPPAATVPMQRFCAVEDRRGGMAVLVHGLYEYEAIKAGSGLTLAVTLLRAVGWLSRPDLTTRPGNAGPQLMAPEAQCAGTHTFRYAFMPYAGSARDTNLHNWAQAFRVPLLEEQCTGKGGAHPPEFSLVQCEPQSLVVSAVKKCEHRNTTIVRLYNASADRVKGKIVWGTPVARAWRVNFSEERLEEITVYAKSRVELDLPAWRIVALEFEAGRRIAGG